MATASPTQGGAAAVPAAPAAAVAGPSRREFLYYIWGASMVMLLGQVGAGIIWFALPRFREGEFGGTFRFDPGELPAQGNAPLAVPEGRFWLSYPQQGLLALYGVCTHLGCLPRWEEGQTRFACPCHGSQYELDGEYITGPAPRGLDRFIMTLTFADGATATTDEAGAPIDLGGRSVDDIVDISVDTGNRINGPGY